MMTLDQYLTQEKMSQRDFARRVHLSPSYLNEILSGVKVPPLVTAYRIQRATGGKVLMSALLPTALRDEASRADACETVEPVEAPAQGRGVGDEDQKGAA